MMGKSFPGQVLQRPIVLMLAAFALAALQGAEANLSLFYLYRQDRWLLLVAALLLMFCVWRLPQRTRPLDGTWRSVLAGAFLMAAAAYAGHFFILSGYDLTRDEQMATFDAAIFAEGHLVAQLGGIWRTHADALNTMFMHPTTEAAAWVSAYLPLNAALRALFSIVGDAALTGPAMVALGAAALWGCARRLWPDDREAAIVALLLYAGSGQILFNGMTAYAMPAHLALNLCWLWLFLRRTWASDVAALAVGFVAVGLHQPIFHPMFAAPILFLLILDGAWRRAVFFLVGYAAIGAFWAWWPGAMWALVEGNALAPQAAGVDYLSRLVAAVTTGDPMRIANMVSNVLRFVAWQHMLLLPLVAIGVVAARRDRLAGALLGGIVLTTAVMLVILPYQGHGFGYRYWHGLIGNFILLAVYGWMTTGDARARWRGLLLPTTAASLLVLLPLQAWMAHAFYAPYAAASQRIDASDADYVIIGGEDMAFSVDLIINPPMLDRQPARLMREFVTPDLAKSLCKQRVVVAVVEPSFLEPIARYFGFGRSRRAAEASRTVAAELGRAGCKVVVVR